MSALLMQFIGGTNSSTYELTLRQVGGKDIPNQISIYPVDFKYKDKVTEYLMEISLLMELLYLKIIEKK